MIKENNSIEIEVKFNYITYRKIYVEERIYDLIKNHIVHYDNIEVYPHLAIDGYLPYRGKITIIGNEKSLTKLKLML